MAAAANGGFVVVWNSEGQDDSSYGVFGRRFSSAGTPLASEFQVNTFTTFPQRLPWVASDASGGFVVAWVSSEQDGESYVVIARRFSSAGAPLTGELQVNTFTLQGQYRPSVAADADGDFVVAWESYAQDGGDRGVFARRFSNTGTPLAAELQVNTYTSGSQAYASVATGANGDFVVAWRSLGGQDGEVSGVFARRFSSVGTALASEFQVNVYTLNAQGDPSVAADADGDFVIAWGSFAQDYSGYGVMARRFSSAGAALASEFQVNTYTPDNQYRPSVAVDAGGNFVVAWHNFGSQDGSLSGIFARRFSSAGAPLASEFLVNSYTQDYQRLPSVAARADGDFVVAWEGTGQDGSDDGVFAQRFAALKTLDIDGNGFAEPLTDGLLALRYLFGFRGSPLLAGAFDVVGCTRCDATAIEAHLAGITLALSPAEAIRLGSELQVNSHTANGQTSPSLAAEADGDFVVAWESAFQDGSFKGVFARRFSSAGAALTSELQLNTYAAFNQSRPSAATEADGDFVVAWESPADGADNGVFARRFSSAGIALTGEFQLNSYTTGAQVAPSVAADADGDFVVAWESYQDGSGYGIFARRFSSAGAALTGEFQVNAFTASDQRHPAVAADADGDFVVAWSSNGQDGSSSGVVARRFSSAGTALASELQVNDYITSSQYRPSVAVDADGDFVIAWESAFQDGSSNGIFAQRFSSAGALQAIEFQVNTYTTDFQIRAAVAAEADGDFLVSWASSQDGSPPGVFARHFSSAGAALASEFQVNTYTAGTQDYPSLALDAHGRFVIAWQDSARDGFGEGVFAQRFLAGVITMDVDGNGSTEPLTDGLLALRYLFGFRGATLTAGAVDLAGCTRCDATAIEPYIAALVS